MAKINIDFLFGQNANRTTWGMQGFSGAMRSSNVYAFYMYGIKGIFNFIVEKRWGDMKTDTLRFQSKKTMTKEENIEFLKNNNIEYLMVGFSIPKDIAEKIVSKTTIRFVTSSDDSVKTHSSQNKTVEVIYVYEDGRRLYNIYAN